MHDVGSQIRDHLHTIYGPENAWMAERLGQLIADYASRVAPSAEPDSLWSQRDAVLITYGDQIRTPGEPTLETLRRFLLEQNYQSLIGTVHLLPFCPYSSDDGFSVIDYMQVDPALGDWTDITRLGEDFDLMFDLVLNHISQQSAWFQDFLAGTAPCDRFFIEVDPAADFSQVTRPRSLPLLTEFETSRGKRFVWTTFSADQIDLNYAEPEVFLKMAEVLLEYVVRGARIIRLDAIAYLWKRLGTSCIHLRETHEIVKLFRRVVQAVNPRAVLLTETNVPHAENVSYFGDGDEAQLVYQFSLPPLLLDAFLHQEATAIRRWLDDLQPPPDGATFFNFTASHDGIGVRPLEGLVPAARIDRLAEWVALRGGRVSTRRQPDGTESPYELNITYVDALADPASGSVERQACRFLSSQAVMLALRGIPGIYFHSLVGTENDIDGMEATGQSRRINRHKFDRDELYAAINRPDSLQQRITRGYRHLLECRVHRSAFHPDGAQQVLEVDDDRLLVFQRTSPSGTERILVVTNFSDQPVSCDSWLADYPVKRDCLSGLSISDGQCTVDPYATMWLE